MGIWSAALLGLAGPASLPPAPPEFGVGIDAPQARSGETKVLFVNFDGADMRGDCGNQPSANCSTIHSGTVEPFPGDAAARASIIQNLRRRLAAFDVYVTWSRPKSGDYDMEMVGTWGEDTPDGVAGVAPSIDCWDERGGETSFTMLVDGSTDGIAEVILQELAHTWGLAHVSDTRDLLYPTTAGSSKTFRDECLPIVADANLEPGVSGCTHHEQACGANDFQNSYQELLLILGAAQPDTADPRVDIRRPKNGGITFPDTELVLSLADDQVPAVMQVTVAIEGLAETTDNFVTPDDYTFPLNGLPEGEHRLVVTAEDESGNVSTDEVVFTVDINGPPPEEGCGCRADAPSRPAVALGWMVLLVGLRRRHTAPKPA